MFNLLTTSNIHITPKDEVNNPLHFSIETSLQLAPAHHYAPRGYKL